MKVFVTVGTQVHDFKRIFEYVESVFDKKNIISQYGNTNYNGTFKFSDDINKYIKECDLVITHGGVGTIIESLYLNKKVIVIPRLKENKEHVDDHQLEITNKLYKENYILMANTLEGFKQCVKNIKDFKPKKHISNTDVFNSKLNELIKKIS